VGSRVRLLKRLFLFPEESFSAVDPCVKTADLPQLVSEAGGIAWGVFSSEAEAASLGRRFARPVLGPWPDCRTADSSFSLLYLDPGEAGRLWLRACWRVLVPGGVLVWMLRPEDIDAGTAGFVCDRFSDVTAWSVPGGLAVVGVRKPALRGDLRAERRLLEALKSPADPARIREPVYSIPGGTEGARVVPALPPEGEARERVASSPLWRMFLGGKERGMAGRPPLPLRPGHVALLLAAGHLDGVVGEGAQAHAVRGSVERVSLPLEVEEGGGGWRGELLVHRPVVSVLLPGGGVKVFR